MSHTKAKIKIENVRRLLISYEPEQHTTTRFSTKDWVEEFAKRFPYPFKTDFGDLISGYSNSDSRCSSRDNASCTDFVVAFTIDYAIYYAKNPPSQLAWIIENIENVETLLWILKLDPDDFRLWNFGSPDCWHELRGSSANGRLRVMDEPNWMDDQAVAAAHIREHHSCEHPSPVCPKHQAGQPSTSRFRNLLGWLRSPTSKNRELL